MQNTSKESVIDGSSSYHVSNFPSSTLAGNISRKHTPRLASGFFKPMSASAGTIHSNTMTIAVSSGYAESQV